jgi:hypothetical protein
MQHGCVSIDTDTPRHFERVCNASRSFQIFRALCPPASEETLKLLLSRLASHIEARRTNPSQALTLSVEIAETLQAIIVNSSSFAIGNLPHLFWGMSHSGWQLPAFAIAADMPVAWC